MFRETSVNVSDSPDTLRLGRKLRSRLSKVWDRREVHCIRKGIYGPFCTFNRRRKTLPIPILDCRTHTLYPTPEAQLSGHHSYLDVSGVE